MAKSQNKYGNTLLCGLYGLVVDFGDTSHPTCRTTIPNLNNLYMLGSASISDSTTGKPLLYCNGMVVTDTLGNLIDNGDRLVDSIFYSSNGPGAGTIFHQASLILPLGSNRYAIIVANVTDSMFSNCWSANLCGDSIGYDELRYNVVDMNLNGGHGKVVVKNQRLLKDVLMNITHLQACRHANGKDWWVLKTGIDSLNVYSFLLTADSVIGPFIQLLNKPLSSNVFGNYGQLSFSTNGSKVAMVLARNNFLMLADFDRCTGQISNVNYHNLPLDTVCNGLTDIDSSSTGVCFSPNNRFVYITKQYNIYQYDVSEPDSNLAWYTVKHCLDTTWSAFEFYGNLFLGPDSIIYIGKLGDAYPQMSTIKTPNVKGIGCNFCRKCFRASGSNIFLASVYNTANYNLGPTNNPNCWPVGLPSIPLVPDDELMVYPNPAMEAITVHVKCKENGWFKMYNALGELVYEVALGKGVVDHHVLLPSTLPNGVYSYQCRYSKEGELKVGKVAVMR